MSLKGSNRCFSTTATIPAVVVTFGASLASDDPAAVVGAAASVVVESAASVVVGPAAAAVVVGLYKYRCHIGN